VAVRPLGQLGERAAELAFQAGDIDAVADAVERPGQRETPEVAASNSSFLNWIFGDGFFHYLGDCFQSIRLCDGGSEYLGSVPVARIT
jgi:hypothetical protein